MLRRSQEELSSWLRQWKERTGTDIGQVHIGYVYCNWLALRVKEPQTIYETAGL